MSIFDESDPFFELESEDEPMHVDPIADAVTTRVLVSGETGVAFASVALFAEPMFQMYEMDPAEAFAIANDPSNADPELITVLSTARLLWAFFSLPPSERSHKRSMLAAHLVGDHPNEEDWLEIEGLLEAVEPYWSAMLPDEILAAQTNGYVTLGFDDLLAHPAFQLSEQPTDLTYGPDSLSEIEARALFAQPLLEDPAVLIDADAFERAMERANAYWTIASLPGADRESMLSDLPAKFADGEGLPDAIRAEADKMIERFHKLFPPR